MVVELGLEMHCCSTRVPSSTFGFASKKHAQLSASDKPDETSFARLGERALMDDRFDEFSVDLTRIRGKQKGAGAGRNEGRRRGKR